MDLTTATPREIDTALAAIYVEIYKQQAVTNSRWNTVEHTVKSYLGLKYYDHPSTKQTEETLAELHEVQPDDYRGQQVIAAFARYEQALSDLLNLRMSTQPYDEEYSRRPWTRAWLVNNTSGHVHNTMSCSTCFPTTEFVWLPEMSDQPEAEIVEEAGERACTVCYPSAPVDVLKRKTRLFTPDEKKAQAAREERAAKREAKDAAKIVVEGMQGWTNEGQGRHVYPTTRGATNAIAGWLKDLAWYGSSHPTSTEWLNNVQVVCEALEAKGVEYDYDKALDAARKKVRREGSTPAF